MTGFFDLTTEEKQKLKNVQADELAFLALKKFFLNETLRESKAKDISVLGAERIALDIIKDIFAKLKSYQPDEIYDQLRENIV